MNESDEIKWITRGGKHIPIYPHMTISDSLSQNKMRLYRGLQEEYSKDFDKSKLDNVNGYESWTDNEKLAKEYAGENGHVYYVDIDKKDINMDDIFDEEGERSLVYYNDKPVDLRGVHGEEYMLYTNHEKWKDLEYNEVIKKENYNNYSTNLKAPISEVWENNNKIGKELFDTPSNQDLDEYVSYGINLPSRFKDQSFKEKYDKNLEGIKELKTPLKEKTVMFVGINKGEDLTKRDIISASINEGTAQLYKTSKNGEVATLYVNENTDIISTYNAKEKGRGDNYHFKTQGEIILMLDTNKIIQIDKNQYLVEIDK